jgi:hypothetical protein
MSFIRIVLTMALVLGLVQPAAEGGQGAEGARENIDVSRLGVDVRRIQRQLNRVATRESDDGLNLQFFVGVFGQAPPIELFPMAEPNFFTLPAPYGAPTHNDIVRAITPREFRSPALITFGVPRRKSRK